jgi:hypothetical protein
VYSPAPDPVTHDRPPTPSAGVAWQFDDISALPRDADSLLRRALLLLNAAGLLAGYFVMFNEWLQLGWFGVLTAMWLAAGGLQEFTEGLRRDPWVLALFGVVFLLLVRSSVLQSPGMTVADLWLGWFKTVLLLPVVLMLWQVARSARVIRRIGLPMVAVAAVAALVSVLVFYRLDADSMFGTRLRNWFVYGGLNSVCTGLTFGFAAVWAAACWNSAEDKKERRLWLAALVPLLAATLFTLSRGAFFALVAAHLALLVVRGWRRAWRPLAVLVVMVALFQLSGPLLSYLAVNDAAARLGVEDRAMAAEMVGDAVVSPNPMRAMMERADNGRFGIFQAALSSMTTWQDWVFGKGMWSSNDFWSCALHWYPEHLHSIFMDALIRGGVPGLAALLGLLGWGAWRALLLARRGEEIWLMLAGFGVVALMFDGDSAFAFLTVPRYEPLLIWVPLVMASARYMGDRPPLGRRRA